MKFVHIWSRTEQNVQVQDRCVCVCVLKSVHGLGPV